MVSLLSNSGRIDIAAIVATPRAPVDGGGPPFRLSAASIRGGVHAEWTEHRGEIGSRPDRGCNSVQAGSEAGGDERSERKGIVRRCVRRQARRPVRCRPEQADRGLDDPPPGSAAAAARAGTAREQLAAARGLARLAAAAGVAPRTEVRVGYGDLEQQLLATARDECATVLVVGARSRRRGSRTLRLIGRADAPVVVVPVVCSQRSAASASVDWGRQRMAPGPECGDDGHMSATNGDDVRSSILCGVDGSQHARLALRHAERLARVLGVRLVVVHVVRPPVPSPGVGPTAGRLTTIPIDALLASGEALLDTILEEEEIVDATRRVVPGFPGDRLADLADEEGAELIVVGSRGRGAVKAAFLGSVSTDLIGVARRPVLVVPTRAHRAAAVAPFASAT
jgi:nucleotide-binding universal stress UspA family protein